MRSSARLLGLVLVALLVLGAGLQPAAAQEPGGSLEEAVEQDGGASASDPDAGEPDALLDEPEETDGISVAGGEGIHGEAAEGHDEGYTPDWWLVIPFALLLLMIATGPLFFPHHWHHHYPKYAVGLGLAVAAFYLIVVGDYHPVEHAAVEYASFIALLASLYIASGGILIRTDFAGTPTANTALLLIGSVISNIIGTTGASMLLIRPFMRLNRGRLKAYHIIFFIFMVSNVGGALTPIGDPPLFLGFLRGVPFFWTLTNIWYIWVPTLLLLAAVFYVMDSRNKEESIREDMEEHGHDVLPGETPNPDEVGDLQPVVTSSKIVITGKKNFLWLAVVIGSVFLDPNVLSWVPDIHEAFHVPFGIREIIMFAVCYLAYRYADKEALRGNEFNFEPIKEVGYLFIGIFLTMQPALELIRVFASENADALGVNTFYYGTGILSGVLDNAPTYVSFLSAAMGKFGTDVNAPADVLAFSQRTEEGFYLLAISVAAVFFGALTYIGNGPNFMVKAIAESAGVQAPSFFGYMIKYSIPILIPIYVLVWLVFFSGWIVPTPVEGLMLVPGVF